MPDAKLITDAALSGELGLLRQRVDLARAGIDSEDVEQGCGDRVEEQEADVEMADLETGSSGSAGWTLYPQEEWQACAIGCLPGCGTASQVRMDLRFLEGNCDGAMDLSC